MTKKKKQTMLELILPLAAQAIHNSMRVFGSELNGSWYKLPDGTLTATLLDCRIVMNMLAFVGLGAPKHTKESDSYIAHINIEAPSIEQFIEDFSEENMRMEAYVQKKATEIANRIVKEKVKKIKEKYEQILREKMEKFKLNEADSYIQEILKKESIRLEVEYSKLFQYKIEDAIHKYEEATKNQKGQEVKLNQLVQQNLKHQADILSVENLITHLEEYFRSMSAIQQELMEKYSDDPQVIKLYRLNGIIRRDILKIKGFQKEVSMEEEQ